MGSQTKKYSGPPRANLALWRKMRLRLEVWLAGGASLVVGETGFLKGAVPNCTASASTLSATANSNNMGVVEGTRVWQGPGVTSNTTVRSGSGCDTQGRPVNRSNDIK